MKMKIKQNLNVIENKNNENYYRLDVILCIMYARLPQNQKLHKTTFKNMRY